MRFTARDAAKAHAPLPPMESLPMQGDDPFFGAHIPVQLPWPAAKHTAEKKSEQRTVVLQCSGESARPFWADVAICGEYISNEDRRHSNSIARGAANPPVRQSANPPHPAATNCTK